MQNKLHECSLSQFFDSLLFTILRARPLNQEPLGFLFVSTLAATMVKSYSFKPLWTMNTTIFQETSNLYHILKPIIGRLVQTIIFGRSLWSSFSDSFMQLCEETLQHLKGFGAFFFQTCDRLFFLFSLFLFFFLVHFCFLW